MSFCVEFKEDILVDDFFLIKKNCKFLFLVFVTYCQENDLRCRITSLISDRKNVKSVSTTHQDGRAFDTSVIGWTPEEIYKCVNHFNYNYKNIAAISASDLIPRACVHHDVGRGEHLHFQTRPE